MNTVYGRRDFLKKLSCGTLGLIAGTAGTFPGCRTRTGGNPPNILLIMADDMGYSDIGCYGGEIRTPRLDSLAENGVRFTRFYNTARCCPTRASLLTGLYPHQAGVGHMMADRGLPGYKGDLQTNSITIAEGLKQAGYAAYMSGKWHVTRFRKDDGPKHNWPLQRGFDRFFGTVEGSGSFFDPVTLTLDNSFIDLPRQPFYYTDAVSDYAVKFIQNHRQKQPGKPFFLYVAYTSPHWPLHALKEDIDRYRGRYDAGWDSLRKERYERMQRMGLLQPDWPLTERDPRVPAWEDAEDKEWQTRRMEVYAAQVDRMDQGIGRILAQLRQSGAMDNTLIFFLADNGGCAEEITDSWLNWLYNESKICPKTTRDGRPVTAGNDPDIMPGPPDTFQSYGIPWANVSNTPFRLYKHWTHEGGVATPLIMHWPKGIKKRGRLCDEPGHLIDIMATCIDVSRAVYPSEHKGHKITPMEGQSLMPAVKNQASGRRALYFEHEGNRAVIEGKWKLAAAGPDGPWELYDVNEDRTETHNLASEHQEQVKRLSEMWTNWARRVNVLPWPWESSRLKEKP